MSKTKNNISTQTDSSVKVEAEVSKLARELFEIGWKAANNHLQKLQPGIQMYKWDQLEPQVITGIKSIARHIIKNYKSC